MISFQTSGLENSLSHLLLVLVVVESFFHGCSRAGRLLFLLNLLCLTRPDFLFFGIPLGLLILVQNRWPRILLTTLIASTPCLAWIVFSWFYYHDVVPNTAHAKLAVYPDAFQSLQQGAKYTFDWGVYDFVAAVSTILLLACAVFLERTKAVLAMAVGLVAYGVWVVWIGGDFMRGRYFTAVLTASVALGALALSRQSAQSADRVPMAMWMPFACLVLLAVADRTLVSHVRSQLPFKVWGIVNERLYYPGYSLRYYLRNGRIQNPHLDLSFADAMKMYADTHGPITVHYGNPGTIGYHAGPKVSVIDTLGLTDRYIASLPRTFLTDQLPRPGHPHKYIPVRYLASRGDISLAPLWAERVLMSDPTIRTDVEQLASSRRFWRPDGAIVAVTRFHPEADESGEQHDLAEQPAAQVQSECAPSD